jgi:hypothetical protein
VVYGANIISFARQKSVSIIEAQLESLEMVGLFQPQHAHVHVVLSYIFSSGTQAGTCHQPPCSDAERTFACSDSARNVSTRRDQADASKAMALIGEQVRRRNCTLYSRMGENLHEWPALYRLWRLACKSPSHLFLYFHNKGATRDLFGVTRRALSEMVLFKEVVASWRAVRSLFALHHPVVQHAGIAPAMGGWELFNFFWAMGSHLRKNVQPIISGHRHYYELWLQREASVSQCSNAILEHSAEDATSAFRSMCKLTAQEAAAREVVGMSRERGCESSLNLFECSIGLCEQHPANTLVSIENTASHELARLGLFDTALHRIQKIVKPHLIHHTETFRKRYGMTAPVLGGLLRSMDIQWSD